MKKVKNKKRLILLFFYLHYATSMLSYEKSFFKDKSGTFFGTINGILELERNNDKSNLILDFQGSKSTLKIVEDKEKMYDTHYKYYTGLTTSGNTKIKYNSYANANEFVVVLNGINYAISKMDGAHREKIKGIEISLLQDKTNEYMIVSFIIDVELNNIQQVLSEYYKKNPGNNDPEMYKLFIKENKQSIKVKKGSVLIFAIKK
ncbi:MAG: hypothetical protein OEZ22_14850 [Spirochaetia bacterium]|nr:hypothetical protein [Spirochaetia bacterium]